VVFWAGVGGAELLTPNEADFGRFPDFGLWHIPSIRTSVLLLERNGH
jgi:hypothetical protein